MKRKAKEEEARRREEEAKKAAEEQEDDPEANLGAGAKLRLQNVRLLRKLAAEVRESQRKLHELVSAVPQLMPGVSVAQKEELFQQVAELLADDIKLYTQLKERFEQQYHAAFGESAAAVSAANAARSRAPLTPAQFSLPSSSSRSPDSARGGVAERLDGWLHSFFR